MRTETTQGCQHNSVGSVDYEEWGSGPTIVLVPGSCSTGAAWRPVAAALDGKFRFVTTCLGRDACGTSDQPTSRDNTGSGAPDLVPPNRYQGKRRVTSW